MRRVRRSAAIACALLCLAAGCASEPTPAEAPASPASSPRGGSTAPPIESTDAGGAAVVPEGFDRIAGRATAADGTVCDLCLWLADDADRRARGLMFVTELGPADGMAFVYDQPRTGNFWMKNTVMPLSIAFFDAGGAFLDAFDMEPCTADPCVRYRTPDDFLIAIETAQGGLGDLAIAPGSILELSDVACP